MADQMLRISGRGEDGLAKAIATDNSGALLLGYRKAAKVEHAELLLRDTNLKTLTLDVSRFRQVTFYVIDTLDTSAEVWIIPETINAVVWDGVKFNRTQNNKITIADKGYAVLLNTFYPDILDRPQTQISLRVQATVAPTAGSIKFYCMGVPN